MSKIFKNYEELKKYMETLPVPFCKVRVESNPFGKGKEQEIYFMRKDDYITSYVDKQLNIDNVDYAYNLYWKDEYKGTFTVIVPDPVKPEVYQVEDWVEITEEARKCGDYKGWPVKVQNMVGGTFQVKYVIDDSDGVSYHIYIQDQSDCWIFPHYCVKKVEKPVETVTIEVPKNLLEQVKKLINQ